MKDIKELEKRLESKQLEHGMIAGLSINKFGKK
jgi:hypothetical protein